MCVTPEKLEAEFGERLARLGHKENVRLDICAPAQQCQNSPCAHHCSLEPGQGGGSTPAPPSRPVTTSLSACSTAGTYLKALLDDKQVGYRRLLALTTTRLVISPGCHAVNVFHYCCQQSVSQDVAQSICTCLLLLPCLCRPPSCR